MVYSHVLISRPGPEAAELAEGVAGLGLKALQLPAFQFEPGFPGIDFNHVWQAGRRKLVIFCSTRAVEFGLRQLPSGFFDSVEIAAIGPATADALEFAGLSVSIIPSNGYNSEALLASPELANEPGQALIFAAPGGRQALIRGLQQLGWQAEFAHVYRTIPLEPDPSAVTAIEGSENVLSIWTSANAIRYLSDSLGARAWDKVARGDFIVTSGRLGEIAFEYTKGQIFVTDGPGNTAIMQTILKLI